MHRPLGRGRHVRRFSLSRAEARYLFGKRLAQQGNGLLSWDTDSGYFACPQISFSKNIETKLHLTGRLSAALRLESQPQRKLHLPRILRAGNRAETRGRAEGPTSPDGRVEVRVIQEIKDVPTELQIHVFANHEPLLKSEVEVVETRTDHNVSTRIAIAERGWHGETGRIEPLGGCFWPGVRIANKIWPL